MEKGLLLIKPEAYCLRDKATKDIEDYGLSIDKRIEQEWTVEKIKKTYPPENYPDWPMARIVDNIIFGKFGKDPMIEAMIITSEKESVEEIKKNLIGPLDAPFFQKPEHFHTLRYKYGLKGQTYPLPMGKDGKMNYFYYNGIHLNPEGRFEIERDIYFPRIA